MNTSRRALLGGGVSLLVAGTLLAACKTPPTPAQVASDITLVAQSFKAEMTKLQGLVPVAAQARVGLAIDDLSAASNAFVQADGAVAQQTVVKRVETDINAVFNSLPTGNLPAWAQTFLNDVNALLPVIELAVGLIMAAGAERTWAARANKAVDPATARLDLSVIAAGRV